MTAHIRMFTDKMNAVKRVQIKAPQPEFPELNGSVARLDEIEDCATFSREDLQNSVTRVGKAIRTLNGGLHSSGVEEADLILAQILDLTEELNARILAQKDTQLEYRRGDR